MPPLTATEFQALDRVIKAHAKRITEYESRFEAHEKYFRETAEAYEKYFREPRRDSVRLSATPRKPWSEGGDYLWRRHC